MLIHLRSLISITPVSELRQNSDSYDDDDNPCSWCIVYWKETVGLYLTGSRGIDVQWLPPPPVLREIYVFLKI